MKLKELKHNHSLTDLLKVLIFSILMITPLLSVATRCLYVICNKNAYQSYYGETINELNIVNTNKIDINQKYEITFNYDTNYTNDSPYVSVDLLIVNANQQTIINAINNIKDDIQFFRIFNEGNETLGFYDADYTRIGAYYVGNSSSNDRFITLTFISLGNVDFTWENLKIYQYNDYSFMDNVFEYSVNKLAESPIISWTQQTAIFTGVNTMTTQLGVNTPTIPMLIVYWFLLTVIYIIIDIIIKIFTWLTHMIGNKSV